MGPIDSLANLAERFPVVTQIWWAPLVPCWAFLKVATIALGYAWTFVKGPILSAQVAFQSARSGCGTASAGSRWNQCQHSVRWPGQFLGRGCPDQVGGAGLLVDVAGDWLRLLLANPITGSWPGLVRRFAGLALVIRKYWDPIAAYVGGVLQASRSAVQPASEAYYGIGTFSAGVARRWRPCSVSSLTA